MTNITTFPGDCFNLGFVNKKSYTFNPTGNTSKYFIGASYSEGMEIEIDDNGNNHGGNQRFYITRTWGQVPVLSTADVSTAKVYNFYYTQKNDRLYVWFNETLSSSGNNVNYRVRVKTIQAALGPEPAADEQYASHVIGVNNAAAFPAPTIFKRNNQVGIGTNSPANSLHVYKAAAEATSGLLIEKANGGNGTNAALFFGVNASGENPGVAKAGVFFERTHANGRGDLHFCVDNTDDTNQVSLADKRMTIDFDGTISMKSTAGADRLTINSTGTVSVAVNMAIPDYIYHAGESDTYFGFSAADTFKITTSGADRLTIDSGGVVNFGVANFSSSGLTISTGELSVRRGADTTHYLGEARIGYVGHSNYAGFAHQSRGNAGDYAMIHESGGTTFINCAPGNDIVFRCNNSDKVIMKNTGRFGFGTTQPLAPIDVSNSVGGTVEINNNQVLRTYTWNGIGAQNNDANGVNVSVNGDGGAMTAHSFLAGYAINFQSDRRIKKDIVEVQDDVALQKFRLLKPSKYKYTEPILSGRSQRDVYGFIAQEVQEVMPEAVTEGIVDGTCQGHIPNIMTMCTVDEQHITPEAYDNLTTEQKADYFYSDQNEMDVGEELANSYIREVITFSNTIDLSVITDNSYTESTTTKTTGDFEQDPETGEYWPVIFYDKNKVTSKKSIIRIIDSSSFIVDERLNTGNLIDGTELLCYGQQPGDFVRLNKDAIFTVTAAALQEVDRQQLSDKVRIATLESQYSNLLSRVTVLENA